MSIMVPCILNICCTPKVINNNFINIGHNINVSFFIKDYQDKSHNFFPSDIGIEPTQECYEYGLDSIQKSYFTVCFFADSKHRFDKNELINLQKKLINGIFFNPNETIITERSIELSNGIYFISINYTQKSKYFTALYVYSNEKLVEFSFLNFNNQATIDSIIHSIRFSK